MKNKPSDSPKDLGLRILDGIERYVELGSSIWHTPGHKGLLTCLDITEIDHSFPAHLVKNAEIEAAKIFGVNELRFLTGGSSLGIKAAMMALGGQFLIEENCHRAVRDGARLCGLEPKIIKNKTMNDLAMPLSAQQIDEALTEFERDNSGRINTIVVTSPDYYGQTADLESISRVAKKHGAFLYVDAAHGAHFGLRKDLFKNATEFADAFNISAHKTLPALTQSAYLCINNVTLCEKIDENLEVLGTTSPSYLLLASLEFAAKYSLKNAQRFDELGTAVKELKTAVKCLNNDDFTRIVVDARHYGLSGEELYFRLKRMGVVSEKYDDRYVVMIISIVDTCERIAALRETILRCVVV